MLMSQILGRFSGLLTNYRTHILSASLTILAIYIGWAYQPTNRMRTSERQITTSPQSPSALGGQGGEKGEAKQSPNVTPHSAIPDRHLRGVPLHFIENQGQTDECVRFYIQGADHAIFFTDNGMVLNIVRRQTTDVGIQTPDEANSMVKTASHEETNLDSKLTTLNSQLSTEGVALKFSFLGANTKPVGTQEKIGKVNYFIGNEPEKWKTAIPTYSEIAYKNLYNGIDLIYKGEQGRLKYDLVVNPGVDISQIRFACEGAEGLSVADTGDLVIKTAIGELRDTKPYCYQEIDGQRIEIGCNFVITKKTMSDEQRATSNSALSPQSSVLSSESSLLSAQFIYGFIAASYNKNYPLIIDPSLVYSTFLGGSGNEEGYGIAADKDGNVYVTGYTSSTNFPTTSGALDISHNGGADVYVTKLSPLGSGALDLIYSTFLGGSLNDYGSSGIAVDDSGNVYVTGETQSTNFPTTQGAFDTSHNGGYDAFVAKLNPTGSSLLYSTYFGGSGIGDKGRGIAADASGNIYTVGYTNSANFPTTTGAFDTSYAGGTDVYVSKLIPLGAGVSDLLYSTFLGGGSSDFAYDITVDDSGNAYVTGETQSTAFPTSPGAFDTSHNGSYDAFVTKLHSTGSNLLYSTFLGGSGNDRGNGIKVNPSGHVYIAGYTASGAFPTTPNAFQVKSGGGGDAFVTKLNPVSGGSSDLLYSTYLGGGKLDAGMGIINADTPNRVYLTGYTQSDDFPLTTNAYQGWSNGDYNAFMTKLQLLGLTAEDLIFSTFLGGSFEDKAWDMVFLAFVGSTVEDGLGSTVEDTVGSSVEDKVYVTGYTTSNNFPTKAGAYDLAYNGGFDVFVSVFGFNPPAIPGDCAPALLGSYNTPGNARGIFVSGNIAYVADGNKGLQIISVSNPANPTKLGGLQTSDDALSVYVSGNIAYVTGVDGKIEIINVSNPGTPVLLNTVGAGGCTFDIYVSGSIAYVASVEDGLTIVDVSNPTNSRELSTYKTPGGFEGARAWGVSVSGNTAFVANGASGLEIINVSDPRQPTKVGNYPLVWARDVHVSGNIAYVTTEIAGVEIIDVSTPTAPKKLGSISTPGRAYDVYVSGTKAYVADYYNGVHVIDVSDPTKPKKLGSYQTSGYARGVYVSGNTAYIAAGSGGLQIIDITDCTTTTTTTTTTLAPTTTSTTATTTTTLAPTTTSTTATTTTTLAPTTTSTTATTTTTLAPTTTSTTATTTTTLAPATTSTTATTTTTLAPATTSTTATTTTTLAPATTSTTATTTTTLAPATTSTTATTTTTLAPATTSTTATTTTTRAPTTTTTTTTVRTNTTTTTTSTTTTTCPAYFKDADGDGYGNREEFVVSCTPLSGYVRNGLDCNDKDPNIRPGAKEVCNGVDDDCDVQVDEGYSLIKRMKIRPRKVVFKVVKGGTECKELRLRKLLNTLSSLSWEAEKNCEWLIVNPSSGTLSAKKDVFTVCIDTLGLDVGRRYECTLKVKDTSNLCTRPVEIRIILSVN